MKINSKIFVVFFVLILLFQSCTFADKKNVQNDNFKGVIIKNYRDYKNHGMSTFDVIDGNYKFSVIPERWPRCWEFADIGDSIIKLPDSLILIIKKLNGKIKYFNYDW